jgi:hypothetical protein
MGMQQFDRAARLYAAMQRLREQSNYRVPPKEVDQQRERLEQIREALGEKEFERAWNEAAGWAVDQAVDYALATCE